MAADCGSILVLMAFPRYWTSLSSVLHIVRDAFRSIGAAVVNRLCFIGNFCFVIV